MSDVQRHQFQYERPRYLPVDTAQTIEVGDLVWMNANDARGADQFTWDTNEVLTRKKFTAKFFGVALEKSDSGDTADIAIGTAGVFEFVCGSATFEVGDLIGAEKATGDTLEDQKVQAVTDPRDAPGRVSDRVGTAATKVLVEIWPRASGNNGGIPEVKRFSTGLACDLTAAADTKEADAIVMGTRIKIVTLWGFVTTTVAADTTAPKVKLTNGTDDLDDALTFADGAAAPTYYEQAVEDANGYDIVEAEAEIEIAIHTQGVDSSSAAGAAECGFDYYEMWK